MRLSGAIIASLCPVLLSAALDPPSLRCTSVAPGGDAVLQWVPPADPGGQFHSYLIFQSANPAGPFTLAGQVTGLAQDTYTHVGAGVDVAPRYYYMATLSAGAPPDTSAHSDTLATMLVQVTQSVPLGSSVVDWNLLHDPPLATTTAGTSVYMEYPAGTWAEQDVVTNNVHHWQRVVDICQEFLVFRVEMPDESGCTSVSSEAGALFQDITPPSIPVILKVTVDPVTNQAVLQWDPSPEADTQGYIVVLSTPGGNIILDTLNGAWNTTYTWPLSDAGLAPESYTVAAIDSCWRGTPPSPNTSAASAPHTTVHLGTRYDRCAGTIKVQRTDYGGWNVDHYELYQQVDQTGPWIQLASMGPDVFDHVVTGVLPEHEYCFYVKAVGTATGQESFSNHTCRVTAYPNVPAWNYIRTVTVEAPNRVRVEDVPDPDAYNKRLVLERSYNGLPWQEVAAAPGNTGPVVTFIDENVLTADRSYTYRVQVEDSCGFHVATSNRGTSILLRAEPVLDGRNNLRWNGYVEWDGTVDHYAIYRSVEGWPFELVGTTQAWSWVDDVREFTGTSGKFCYYVEAREAGNPDGIDAVSGSNVACAVQHEEVWIPNAFIDGGFNDSFKPVLAYVGVERYEFTIYNRWGQQIWTTTNRDQAWDGRVDGTLVPQGIYAYYCSFLNGSGKTVVRSGTVTFLHAR